MCTALTASGLRVGPAEAECTALLMETIEYSRNLSTELTRRCALIGPHTSLAGDHVLSTLT